MMTTMLLLLITFFVGRILFLVHDSLLLIILSLNHDLLDGILSFTIHLLVLEFLVVHNYFIYHFDVWLRHLMEGLQVVRCLRDTLPSVYLFVKALVKKDDCWRSGDA